MASVTIDATDMVSGMSRRELLALIKEIDAEMQDWDFTLALCDYFDKQRKEYEAELDADRQVTK